MTTALVLLSGGLDSATIASLACKRYGAKNVSAISIDYGQTHRRELDSARQIALYLGIGSRQHHILELGSFFRGGGSALFGEAEMPDATYDELHEIEGVSPTYVPFRNGTLLSIATAKALTNEIDLVYAGMHADDAHNWAYPDCTPEFIGAMANAIYVGSYHKVRLVSPLMWMTKTEVVQLGNKLGTPFALTWSCYEGGEEHCGTCPACRSRQHAFKGAGLEDATVYASR